MRMNGGPAPIYSDFHRASLEFLKPCLFEFTERKTSSLSQLVLSAQMS
jgi:hypothetical protein